MHTFKAFPFKCCNMGKKTLTFALVPRRNITLVLEIGNTGHKVHDFTRRSSQGRNKEEERIGCIGSFAKAG